jgi:TolB protein
MNADGTGIRRLTTSLGLDIKPTWSPDGQQIAFRSQRDGNDEIYVMNADGTCQRNLTNDPADDRSPAWAPDGRTIAFDHFFNDTFQDISLIDIDGSNLRRVTMRSGEYPSWSPDGSRIAFASARTGHYEIYVIDRDGSNEIQLTHHNAYSMYPAWSPDGTWIAYERGVDGFDESMKIDMMHADGSHDQQLTSNDSNDRFPAWSLNGGLAWSENGTIMVAESAKARPHATGTGQFPAWRP